MSKHWTGLSAKALGATEYWRQRREMMINLGRIERPVYKKRWTGLSQKLLGGTEYVRQWRALRKKRGTSIP